MTEFQLRQQDIDFLKTLEGCKLKAYRDSGGVATIGYGHTFGVKMGMTITKAQAEQYLREDLVWYQKEVNKLGVARTNNQYAALVFFAYNVGVANLRSSTLLKKIKLNRPVKEIQDEFLRWKYVTKTETRIVNGAKQQVKVRVEVKGLLARRQKEAEYYARR